MFPLSRKEKRNADGALAGGALHALDGTELEKSSTTHLCSNP